METNDRPVRRQLLALFLFLLACAVVAGLGSLFTMSAMDGWYADLEQPDWEPPDWVFGPIWSILYLAIGVAAWLVWRERGWEQGRIPLVLWSVQLGLNLLWTAIFFGLEMPGAGLVEIVALWLAIAATIVAFWPVSRLAALLLVPYFGWVSYAAALNYAIWTLN